MKKNKIRVDERERRYFITNGKYIISVIVNKFNEISIYRQMYFNKGFDFIESDPEVVENVAKLMLEAVKLVQKEKVIKEVEKNASSKSKGRLALGKARQNLQRKRS